MSEFYGGINYSEEIKKLNESADTIADRVESIELLLFGDKRKGIEGICTSVAIYRKYVNYIVGGWALLSFVWFVGAVILPIFLK